jgi:hypothetical protein
MPNNLKKHKSAIKCTKWPKNIQNGYKMYEHLPLQDPPKFTQIWIFGLKIYHLATLAGKRDVESVAVI